MLKRCFATLLVLASLLLFNTNASAQGPGGKKFGFGIIIGDPLGLTGKLWLNKENALVFDVGASYFGSPRILVDYLWHMDVFQSKVVKLYAGPGAGLGFGGHSGIWHKDDHNKWYSHEGSAAMSVRCMIGVNIIPKRTPLEIFIELGPNIGIIPSFGAALDGAIGVRFYP